MEFFDSNGGLYNETNTSGMTANYIGFYYIDFGEYPQTSIGATLPNPAQTNQNLTTLYYEDSITGLKYGKNGSNYYKVEPVRWLVIGNGNNLNNMGFPDKNDTREGITDLADNQLLLISEKVLFKYIYSNVGGPIYWTQSTLYDYFEATLENQIFENIDSNLLGDFKDTKTTTPEIIYTSKLSLLTYYTEREREHRLFYYGTYCSGAGIGVLKCSYTSYAGSNINYWLRWDLIGENIWSANPSSGAFSWYHRTATLGIRPIILLNT